MRLSSSSSPFKAAVSLARPELRSSEASKQSQRLEARDPVAADDQMVVDGDAQGAAGFDDLAGDLDVGGGGRGVARGVVVEEPMELAK